MVPAPWTASAASPDTGQAKGHHTGNAHRRRRSVDAWARGQAALPVPRRRSRGPRRAGSGARLRSRRRKRVARSAAHEPLILRAWRWQLATDVRQSFLGLLAEPTAGCVGGASSPVPGWPEPTMHGLYGQPGPWCWAPPRAAACAGAECGCVPTLHPGVDARRAIPPGEPPLDRFARQASHVTVEGYPKRKVAAMPTDVLIVNIAVLFAVLEADLGRRKISAFRILRPLLLAAGIIPLFIVISPWPGNGEVLDIVSAALGTLLGDRCSHRTDEGQPSMDPSQQVVSTAGAAYGAFWAFVIGARSSCSPTGPTTGTTPSSATGSSPMGSRLMPSPMP